MNRVFGKKKASGPPPPSLDQASSSMNNQLNDIDSKLASLEKELRVHKDKLKTTKNAAAKKNIQKRAMEVLKRKRMYEQKRDQLSSQQFNIDQVSFGIESAKATVTTVAAMKSASSELKRTIKQDMNIDDVDDLADEMMDLMEDMNEINEALGQNFSTPVDIDESELEAELDCLDDELEEEDLVGDTTPSYLQESSLPLEPTNAVTQSSDQTSSTPLADTS